MDRPLIAVVCDPNLPMRPFADLLRDRSQHLVLIPDEEGPALRALEMLRPDAVVVAGGCRDASALAAAIRARLDAPLPLILGAITDEPAGAVFDERIEPPLTPRKLAAVIERLICLRAS